MTDKRTAPIALLPFRAARCPTCSRVYEATIQYCPACEVPTHLYSPSQEHVEDLGAKRCGWCGEDER